MRPAIPADVSDNPTDASAIEPANVEGSGRRLPVEAEAIERGLWAGGRGPCAAVCGGRRGEGERVAAGRGKRGRGRESGRQSPL